VAVIDKTEPHHHKVTTEIMKWSGGAGSYVNGKVYIGPKTFLLRTAGEIHSATGAETWVKVTSKPGWSIKTT
jgi:hypothetical protein